jgi:VTC domain
MSLSFQLIDDGLSRTDLAERRETKFTFDRHDLVAVRKLLESNSRRLVHNQPVSTVRSLYLDDARLSACHANLDGLGLRRKLRLRWYDQLLPGSDLFLEVKWRNNRVTGKHRFQVRASEPVGEQAFSAYLPGLQPVVPSELLPDLLNSPEPVVVVEYQREHFASTDGQLRVTLDYDITFYRQLGRQRLAMDFPYRMERLAVLEGKTPIGSERELRAMLYPLSLRAARCSKYVNGCRLLGLIPSVG